MIVRRIEYLQDRHLELFISACRCSTAVKQQGSIAESLRVYAENHNLNPAMREIMAQAIFDAELSINHSENRFVVITEEMNAIEWRIERYEQILKRIINKRLKERYL